MLICNIIEYKELQFLAGLPSFAAKVVWPGHAFLCRIFDALANRRRHIRFCLEIQANLQ